jgi:GTP-binding protein Era
VSEQPFRCGFVAVVGRPNVGKSTLINTILGRKISIVTPKPQTTRHRILAVDSRQDCQIIFVDTPGLHRKAGKAMNRMMNRTATSALIDADVVLFVTEAMRWTDEDQDVLVRLQSTSAPVIALLNKTDKVHPKEKLLQVLARMSERYDFAEVMPISAKRDDNLDRLMKILPGFLPESEPLFPEDMFTDRSKSFRAAEIIREKLTLDLQQEVPYGLTVQIERYVEDESGIEMHAVIWVERNSQKGIVVGKGGSVLKKIGRAARVELKAQAGVPVHLELWVKVKDNWADSEKDLLRLGYESP